jgi:hypothetical protein
MSDVTVSISLSRKEQGALYMKSLRQSDRIKELKEALRRIQKMAEGDKNWEIMTAAKAALEPGAQLPASEQAK